MKFTKIEEYRKATEGVTQKQTTLQHERNSALEKLQALKADYTALITKSITTGENVDAALDKLSDSISEAERTFKRKDTAVTMSSAIQPGMSRESVRDAWNNEFLPEFKTDVLDPLVSELEAARDSYYAKYLECLSVSKEIEMERQGAIYTLDPNYSLSNKYVYSLQKPDYFSKTAAYTIKDADIKKLARGELPDNGNKKGGAL